MNQERAKGNLTLFMLPWDYNMMDDFPYSSTRRLSLGTSVLFPDHDLGKIYLSGRSSTRGPGPVGSLLYLLLAYKLMVIKSVSLLAVLQAVATAKQGDLCSNGAICLVNS